MGKEQQAAYRYTHCNARLTIRYAELRDTGRYSCMARNSHGETTSQPVTLAVQLKGILMGEECVVHLKLCLLLRHLTVYIVHTITCDSREL